jgi:hypothetical protein
VAAAFLFLAAAEISRLEAAPTRKSKAAKGVKMDAKQIRQLITETLQYLAPEIPFSSDAVELLLLTAAQETQLGRWIKQIKGPARGIFQMEPATERHVIEWMEKKHPSLAAKVMALNVKADDNLPGGDRDMIFNLAYQAAMARVNYLRFPGEIPADRADQAIYYKQYWNTPAGKATAAEALIAYQWYVLGVNRKISA